MIRQFANTPTKALLGCICILCFNVGVAQAGLMTLAIKRLKFIVLGCICILCFNVGVAQAGLMNIVIDSGQMEGLPIAVVPFAFEGEKAQGENISQIIRNDLLSSGQFRIPSFQEIQQLPVPTTAQEVNVRDWQPLKVENIVVGRIQKTSGSKYKITVQLVNVVKETNASQPLLSLQFDNVHESEFRRLSHRVSDLLFEKMIGVKGIFSTRIAYVSIQHQGKYKRYNLEVADADGFRPKTIFQSPASIISLAWSPDGNKIAFVSFENERIATNVVDVHTGRVERVSHYPGMNNAPAWSPDGHQLAVVLSKDGNPKIYIINLQAKTLSRITDGVGADTEPHWTPDGRSIVFTSDRGGKPQIYRVTLNTGKVDRLTFKGSYNARPSLTPDGSQLITLHRSEAGGFCVAAHQLKTGTVRILTQAGLNDSPTLAPNGMMVLYGSREGSHEVLGAVTIDGRLHLRLPAQNAEVREPAWGPIPAS